MEDTVYKLGEVQLFTEEQVERKISELNYEKAPLIIHQRFCHELVQAAKRNPKVILSKVPEYTRVMEAIKLLEEFYPVIIEIHNYCFSRVPVPPYIKEKFLALDFCLCSVVTSSKATLNILDAISVCTSVPLSNASFITDCLSLFSKLFC